VDVRTRDPGVRPGTDDIARVQPVLAQQPPDQRCEVVAGLPRRQTRVLTWPVVTVFGFIAAPASHIFLKPTVTRRAAETLGVPFEYRSRPNWETYAELLRHARAVRKDLPDLHPRDMIDIQSFLWVQGSDEYPDRG